MHDDIHPMWSRYPLDPGPAGSPTAQQCVSHKMISINLQAISLLQKLAYICSKPIACMHNSSVHLMQDVSTWGIKLEALKLVQTFVQFFSKLVGPYLPPLMAQAWQLFVGSQPVYQHLVIDNAPNLDADQVFAQCLFLLPYLLLLVLLLNAYRRQMFGNMSHCKRASLNQLVQGPMLGVMNHSKSSALSTFAVRLVLPPRLSLAGVYFHFHCWCSQTIQSCTLGMFYRLVSVQCRQMRRETIWTLKA